MKPTDRQIEAAAEAMHRYDVDHGSNIDGLASAENYLPIAKAALTATAEVGEQVGINEPDSPNPGGYITMAMVERREAIAATIERCAQRIGDRALQYDLQNNQEHALWNECMENIAAIRALKDKP